MEEEWVSGVEVAPKLLPNTLLKRRENCTHITPILFIYSTRLRRLSPWLFELANAQCTALVVVSRY